MIPLKFEIFLVYTENRIISSNGLTYFDESYGELANLTCFKYTGLFLGCT